MHERKHRSVNRMPRHRVLSSIGLGVAASSVFGLAIASDASDHAFTTTAAITTSNQPSGCDELSEYESEARDVLNALISGTRHRISDRKTLVIGTVEQITFRKCSIAARIRVALERRFRKDAAGRVWVRGNVILGNAEACVVDAYIHEIELDHTLNVGENFYARVANWFLPDAYCIRL